MLKFIDVVFSGRKGSSGSTSVKIACDDGALLRDAVKLALRKFVEHNDECHEHEGDAVEDAVEDAFGRINSITCNGCELHSFVDSSEATLIALNSKSTPLLEEFQVSLTPRTRPPLTQPGPAKKLKSVADVLMGKEMLEVVHLEWVEDTSESATLQDQVNWKLRELCEEGIGLGFCDQHQKQQLASNLSTINGSLCFMQKHWESLLKNNFPELQSGTESPLLNMLATCTRKGGSV